MTIATAPPPAAPPKILGRLLVESGRVTPEQVDEALQFQAGSGLRLGELLVRKGWVDAETVARLLARQLGLPYEPAPLRPESEAAVLLPAEQARRLRVLPLSARARQLRLAMADPLDLDTVRDVAFRTGRRVAAVVVSPATLEAGLSDAYGGAVARIVADLPDADIDDDPEALERAAAAAPVVRLVDELLHDAASRAASDVHIEGVEGAVRVRLRVDGVLTSAHQLPSGIHAAVVSRLKILAGMDIAIRRRPQDGGFVLRGRPEAVPLRVSTLPAGDSEKVVVRLLDPGRVPGGLSDLGMAPRDEERIRAVIAAGRGVLLATGPTGSGKSSTLQAALKAVDRDRLHVVALEDPVEYRIPGVVHVQMAARAGLTFASALRAVLRQDPDVVMVGEIRDRETAEIAMAAAVTGHLVLSSLHTIDAPSAVTRLLHMGVPPYLVSAGLAGVIAQRLVRRRCGPCDGRGCGRCSEGFAGRTGVFQVLTVSDSLREAIAAGASAAVLRRLSREAGMASLADDARRVVAERVTAPDEAARVVRGDPGASVRCGGCGEPAPAEARLCPWCGRPRWRWCRCG
ncbi:MAG: Flp pilus assembly complex ATPase component TadA, partial [Gemmatimonadetes bacterium]|nr:Flp pilus assembly complex ATPase component TadA [Gemmatimonadota bacterium]